ncbi:Ribokinase-like protein [Flammula alnicola]|nr:Ribokinase-like protein [Flammula alnicola]
MFQGYPPQPHTLSTTMSSSTYSLFCMGNPLLDMQVRNGEALLEKYGLKANDAILAEEKHAGIYDELVAEHEVTYVAGGAAQNAARGAAYVLPPGSVVYTGAVGDDDLAEQLKEANKREGLDQVYQVKKDQKTGACAVIITGHWRSLVTTLRVAEKFEKSHLLSPQVAPLVDNAKFFYIEGYFLTHGIESALELSTKASAAGKTFILNISAPFIAQFFGAQLKQIIPYTDVIIGNEAEAEAWASANGYPDIKDLPGIARSIALLPKVNAARPRTVVFTQGAQHTVLITADKPDEPKIFPVNVLTDNELVDTNGAGDAFAGGFLGGLVSGKNLDTCVLAGHALARACVQQVGPQYPWPKVNIL